MARLYAQLWCGATGLAVPLLSLASPGLLIGQGTARPVLHFLDKDTGVRPGDVVSTSPASTLLPANVTVGVIQTVNDQAVPAPEAVVQLSAPLDAVDWVQVVPRRAGA